ncbi:MAG: hypothetical protein H6825_11630 [Planctomycetes bacterium]|nr:hypothetical protein [Planctomycetota bacterium]
MTEPTNVGAPEAPSRLRKIGTAFTLGTMGLSVVFLLMQAFGPEQWRAGNPVFGPEGDPIGPPPTETTAPAVVGDADAAASAANGKTDEHVEKTKAAEDAQASESGDGQR